MTTARVIREGELDELLSLYRQLNPDDPERSRTDALLAQWRAMLSDESLEIVVVEHDAAVVSTCMLSITRHLTRNARPFGLIENVVTHEDYRGRGFGSASLEKAVDVAERRDCYKVMLSTGSDEAWKHAFYERCGFDKGEKTGFVYDLRD